MSLRSAFVFTVVLVLVVPLLVFARPKNEHNVVLTESVLVGSTQLQAGTYKVEWQRNGPSLQVSFLERGKTVATTEARMTERKYPSPYDEIVTSPSGKTRALQEIDFRGQKDALVLTSNHSATN